MIDRPRRQAVDLPALRRALAEAISSGEVRADRLSRALYSTDASVYQIVPLVRRPARDRRPTSSATVRACGRFGVPLTARGGGTSQAGQSIGPGVILDCSKHFNRVLEINADGALGPRRAGLRARRPEPGAQAARPAVRARHLDRRTGRRSAA